MRIIDKAMSSEVANTQVNLMERAFEMVGLTRRSANEFTSANLADFNTICTDVPSVDYYSIGAWKNGKTMSPMLKNGHDLVVDRQFDL